MRFALVAFGNEESYGLLFVGGELLEHGQEIRYFDAEDEDVGRAVCDWRPDFVLFSPMTTFFPWALGLSRRIKRALPRAISVFGGHHAMSSPGISELDGVDIVIVGPVRGSVPRILSGERGAVRTPLTTPDDLPRPARKQYYEDVPRMGARYRKVMLSTLGCPWNCYYCSSAMGHLRRVFGARDHKRYYLARRPLSAIIAEARELLEYDTVEVEWVDDDVFAGADVEDWIPHFAGVWKEEIGLPMYVSTTSRNALKVSDAVLSALKGVVNCIGMGVQAIRPESLALLNRSWDSEARMKAAYDRLTSFGYSVNLQAIVGLPVEDPVEDALETVRGMQRIGPGSVCSCYPLMIYPGTVMEKYVAERGIDLNAVSGGDTNSGVTDILFPPETAKQLRNICKLATLFVKYEVDEKWMRALLGVDFDDDTSKDLSSVRYFECVTDRLKHKGEEIFEQILSTTKLRY
ncbi:MAG: cobalamin-dependent protein [Deltaproteobacteria bacterium]|nr:cobalamin-dependent protein [Deltaproteobacteria bacterium]